ncbi:MAG: hypothetical protein ACN6I5_05670 [Hyphomicrobiales bacterium]
MPGEQHRGQNGPRHAAALLLAGVWLLAAGHTHAAESVYTTLDLDACAVLDQDDESGGISLQCDGLPGHPVFASEGDLRFDVDYGVPNDRWESFGPFNSVGETVEWRVADGEPHAAILRFFIDTGMTGGPEDKGQALVVSRVGTDAAPGCVVAVVDAKVEQANGVARGAAAMAPRFACGTDMPVAIGPEDSFARSFNSIVPEGQ